MEKGAAQGMAAKMQMASAIAESLGNMAYVEALRLQKKPCYADDVYLHLIYKLKDKGVRSL